MLRYPLAEDLRFQLLERGVVNPPRQSVGPCVLPVVHDLSHLGDVLSRQQGRHLLAGVGGGARAAVGSGQGLLPLGEGLYPFGQLLVEAPDWAHPQLGADEEDHRPLHAPHGVLTAIHGELGQWPVGPRGCRLPRESR